MRIRKNAKLSPLFFSSSSSSSSAAASSSQNGSVPVVTFQTHVCQLNQSPWDVIPFDSDSIQFEVEDSFNAGNGRGGGSAGDSIGADESVATMMDVENKSMMLKIEDVAMVDDDNHDNNHKVAMDDDNGDKGVAKNLCCQSFDGKGWPCKNEAKRGQSICNHHLSLLRSYNNNNNNNNTTPSTKKAAAAIGPRRGGRARAGKKTPSSNSNPYEFYYYSGFGPLWGKRRGDRNGGEGSKNGGAENSTESENIDVVGNSNNNAQGVVQIDNNEGFDYEDNDEDEDVNDDNGKKRMRKPVKARSLKSLM